MRLICQLPGLSYLQDNHGRVWSVPHDGSPGTRVPFPVGDAAPIRRHSEWLRRIGREQCADVWLTAAEALEALGEPLTAA